MNICIDCKHYIAGESESRDTCNHELSRKDYSIRTERVERYTCEAMLCGICKDHQKFEPRNV